MRPSFPYVLEPQQHQLKRFYQGLNRVGFVLVFVVIVLNELFVRKNLVLYQSTPGQVWSMIALTLNAKSPVPFAQTLIFLFPLLACSFAMVFSQLPKWSTQQFKRNLKSGLPAYGEYGEAFFFIDSKIQQNAFHVWHSVLMMVSLFFGVFGLCMCFNLFRS